MILKYEYDQRAEALYVTVGSGTPVRQVEAADGVIVDLDDAGRPIGIDVMVPGGGWNADALVEMFALDDDTARGLRALATWRPARTTDAGFANRGPRVGFGREGQAVVTVPTPLLVVQ